MEIVSDMIIKFTADDIPYMLFEKMRKNIPGIDILNSIIIGRNSFRKE